MVVPSLSRQTRPGVRGLAPTGRIGEEERATAESAHPAPDSLGRESDGTAPNGHPAAVGAAPNAVGVHRPLEQMDEIRRIRSAAHVVDRARLQKRENRRTVFVGRVNDDRGVWSDAVDAFVWAANHADRREAGPGAQRGGGSAGRSATRSPRARGRRTFTYSAP